MNKAILVKKPTIAKNYCLNCGKDVPQKGRKQARFCSTECSKSYWAINKV